MNKMIHNYIRTPTVHSIDVADALAGSMTVRSHVTTVRRLPTQLRLRILGFSAGAWMCCCWTSSCSSTTKRYIYARNYVARQTWCRQFEVTGTSPGSIQKASKRSLILDANVETKGSPRLPCGTHPYSRPQIVLWEHGSPGAGTFMEIIVNVIVINSADMSPSWEAIRRSASQRVTH